MKHRRAGFTIVELLIVIVVIGILAAVTIVAYSGIRQNAENTVKSQTAKEYSTALTAYTVTNESYPPMSAGSVCLGQGYTIRVEGDTAGECGGSDYQTKEDSTFNGALRQLVSIPQASNKVVVKQDGVTFVGVTLTRWDDFKVDGISNPYFMQYVLEGSNQPCKVSGLVQMKSGVWGDMTPATDQKNTFYDSKSTTCVVALPNPS